ncbi:Y-family DNA polymerase [Mucilaginibacter ginkgonis]|uniref:Y-family DNA polymerase n=1 Tax=Mucilaginibacter ginkgonis TaxID=2682091 RepID=A0A6I4I3J7_9SPHI|nr:Y-family DNA polymerase [Mucilaginibacter ginkgonis]QQL49208.1 Y-family DNA polymerase [Mucilaginibacter ginkgonis]
MFAHVDINNFYASCQRLFRPELEGKIIVVLSNNDGCVIARSDEAKALGIKMGDAEFQVRDLLNKNGAYIFSSNYALYADMSARMMNNLARYTYMLMVYSIDECFMAIDHMPGVDLEEYIANMRDAVVQNTGLPITIGVGKTASLAKFANRAAKRARKKYMVLDTMDKVDAIINDFDIEDLWGVGFSYYKKLTAAGIMTAGDFRRQEPGWVQKQMTIQGLRLWRELWGEQCHVLNDLFERSKAICSSKSFNTYQTELCYLEEAIATYTATVASKLRVQESMALNINVFLRTNKHRKDHDQYYPSITLKLPFSSNSTAELTKVALQALRAIYTPGYYYMKGGVTAIGIVPAGEVQYDVFTEYQGERQTELSGLMDKINARYGKGTLRVAIEGYKKHWIMKQDYLSPNYTTRWQDIIKPI